MADEPEGGVCLDELTKWQKCFSPKSDVIYLPSDTNQEEAETTVYILLKVGLPQLFSSTQCEAAIKPFLCLYLFGLCDSDNQVRRGTHASCERLRDDVCAREWTEVESRLVLPNCSDFQQEKKCQGIHVASYVAI